MIKNEKQRERSEPSPFQEWALGALGRKREVKKMQQLTRDIKEWRKKALEQLGINPNSRTSKRYTKLGIWKNTIAQKKEVIEKCWHQNHQQK